MAPGGGLVEVAMMRYQGKDDPSGTLDPPGCLLIHDSVSYGLGARGAAWSVYRKPRGCL